MGGDPLRRAGLAWRGALGLGAAAALVSLALAAGAAPQDPFPRYRAVRELEARSQDPAGFEGALRELLELWDEYTWVDPTDPDLPTDVRMAAGECARAVADLDRIERMPEGWDRRAALARACELLAPDLADYPREDRAWLEVDLLEETANAGDFEVALEIAAAARRDFADVPQALVEVRLLEANSLQVLGRFQDALTSAVAAQKLLAALTPDQEPQPYAGTFAKVVEGQILIAMGVPDRAAPLLAECERDLTLPGNEDCEAMVMTLAVRLALARDDFAWVIRTLPPRLEAGGFRGDLPRDTEVRWLDVAVARARQALLLDEGLEEVREELDALLDEGGIDDISRIDGPLALAELDLALDDPHRALERVAALERNLDVLLAANAPLPRQPFIELKGRIHLQMASGPDTLRAVHSELERSYRALLQAWDTAPAREGGVGFLLFDRRSSHVATLIQVTIALDPGPTGIDRALGYLLEAEARSTLTERLGPLHADIADIRARLVPEGGGIVAYVPAPHGSVLFAITTDGVRALDVASAREVREHNSRWGTAAVGDGSGDAELEGRLAAALRDAVLPAALVREVASWSALTVVGAEGLGFVPFEALPTGAPGSERLGLVLPIAYLPSLTSGLGLVRRAGPARPDVTGARVALAVGLGAVVNDDGTGQPALPWRDADFDALRAPWARGSIELYTEPVRARDAVLDAASRGVLLLEVVAHGVREADRERGQGIAFGPAADLFPDHLIGRTAPPIVALAVCDAGRGLLRSGDEGVSHLGGALLAAGSHTVLLSRHDLSFEATLALLGAFNRHVARGATLSGAMLAARREVAGSSGWSHPRYHALLHVYGAGHEVAPEGLVRSAREVTSRRWFWAIGAAATVGAAALLFRRTRRMPRR